MALPSTPVPADVLKNSCRVCSASCRVGVIIIASGWAGALTPLFWYSVGVLTMLLSPSYKIARKIGNRKANVFPDPVGAMVTMSRALEIPGNDSC